MPTGSIVPPVPAGSLVTRRDLLIPKNPPTPAIIIPGKTTAPTTAFGAIDKIDQVASAIRAGDTAKTAIILAGNGGGGAAMLGATFVEALEAALGTPVGTRTTLAGATSAGNLFLAPVCKDNPLPAKAVADVWETRAQEIFHADLFRQITTVNGLVLGARFSAKGIENVIADVMGNSKLSKSDVDYVSLIAARGENVIPLVASSFATGPGSEDYYTRDVIRSSTAVPGLFSSPVLAPIGKPELGVATVDGAMWQNNPSFISYLMLQGRLKALSLSADRIVVLGIGSGATPPVSHVVPPSGADRGLLENAPELLRMLIDATTQTPHYVMTFLSSIMPNLVYIPWNPLVRTKDEDPVNGVSGSWTDGSPDNMKAYRHQANEALGKESDIFKKVVDIVKSESVRADVKDAMNKPKPDGGEARLAVAASNLAKDMGAASVTARLMANPPLPGQ